MRDPLVLILHLAYMFLPVGLTLIALSVFFPQCVPVAAGVHALGGGAIGSMTLAVMVRATLGHTGRELKAGKGTLFIFAAALLAGTCRIIGAFAPHVEVIQIAGLMWAAAFVGFAAVYGTALTRPRTR